MRKYALVMKIHSFQRNMESTMTQGYIGTIDAGITMVAGETVLTDIRASDYVQYCNNNETITVVFDGGGMYEVMNSSWCSPYYAKLEQEFSDILAKEGYYYELGNAWNLTLYKI